MIIKELKSLLEFSKEPGIKLEDVWRYLQKRIEELDEHNYVYEFLYNSDAHDGGATTMSLHFTKEGAENALNAHKQNILNEWKQDCIDFPETKEYPFDFDQWWGIRKTLIIK